MSQQPLFDQSLPRDSSDSFKSRRSFDLILDAEPGLYETDFFHRLHSHIWTRVNRWRRRSRGRSRIRSRKCLWLQLIVGFIVFVIAFTAIFLPSYTSPPARYGEIRKRCASSHPGSGNINSEKVFVVASIFDPSGKLAGETWGQNVLRLIDLLGPDNTYLSIYQDGAGEVAKTAFKDLENRVACPHTLLFEEESAKGSIPPIHLPDGSTRVKRIAYLAEVRNRALRPLSTSKVKYARILYLNDIVFDPVDAVQLLFATNADNGKADYRAACAMDFINPFKFYDTFATRDAEGFSMGLPIYPWFSNAGSAQSRLDVQRQTDAVHVRSCWGGMVAFDAAFFQSDLKGVDVAGQTDKSAFSGFRFRASPELFWEPSECCLIHADIQGTHQQGIYLNPYVRVAYTAQTLSWLGWTRRIERLFTPAQYLINRFVGLPWSNPRQATQQWQEVSEEVWTPDASLPAGGSFKMVDRIASHDGYCGTRSLEVLRVNPQKGEKSWEFVPVPIKE